MSTVFCWGATHDGQLGLGGLDAECFSTATENNVSLVQHEGHLCSHKAI